MNNSIINFVVALVGIIGFVLTVITMIRTKKIQDAVTEAKAKEFFRVKAFDYKTNLNRVYSSLTKSPQKVNKTVIQLLNKDLSSLKLEKTIFNEAELEIIKDLSTDVNELYQSVIVNREIDENKVASIARRISDVISIIDKK